VKNCFFSGIADSTREKSCFQAKNELFHSGVLFFHARCTPAFTVTTAPSIAGCAGGVWLAAA
jgi:hypothetical protein